MRGIAVIGETTISQDFLTRAGAIAVALAKLISAQVGFRSVARSDEDQVRISRLLESQGVVPWLTSRGQDSLTEPTATIRMGDPIDIGNVFEQDLVILDFADSRLRRFLADLPVHTQPNVRIMTSLATDHEILAGESLADLMRFDVLIGRFEDYAAIPGVDQDQPIADIQDRLIGSNLRLAIGWDEESAQMAIASLEEGLIQARTGIKDWTELFARCALGVLNRDSPTTILGGLTG